MAFALAATLFCVAVPSFCLAAGGPVIAGFASVVDGDTLELEGRRIRLEGIDAPELAQSCGRKWLGSWSCGTAAASELANLIGKQELACESQGQDKYGRTLGVCYAGDTDINAEMVRRGFAWAFVKYSQSYVEAETQARAQRAGIWQGDAEPAWVFRQKKWDHVADAAPKDMPAGCTIKGNISQNGNVYHMPWSPWYARITVDASRGERWFCSETEAQAAGWRPAATR